MPGHIGEVLPFRFCEIENLPDVLTAADIRQTFVHIPFNDGAATFESSDPVLNDVWALCKHTVKATSFCGLYVDGDRERVPYEGDAYINQLSHYCVDAEYQTGPPDPRVSAPARHLAHRMAAAFCFHGVV